MAACGVAVRDSGAAKGCTGAGAAVWTVAGTVGVDVVAAMESTDGFADTGSAVLAGVAVDASAKGAVATAGVCMAGAG